MKLIAEDVYQLRYFPPHSINVYLVGGVVVDAATRRDFRRIARQVEGREVSAHALTHAHPDHQGSSARLCEELGLPFWVGADDVEAAEGGGPAIARKGPDHPMNPLSARLFAGPGRKVDRVLREGDELAAGFIALETPGHSAGHLSFWREADRTLIAGDVLFGGSPVTGRRALRQPPRFFTPDPERNRESARRLASLEPALVCFGHGPPLRDTRAFVEFVNGLPR